MIKARFGADLDQVVHRVLPFLDRVRIKPDTLTLMGVAVSFLAACAFGAGHPFWGGVALLGAGLFDLVDGVVARSQGSSGSTGAFFDSSMDRVSDLLVFSGMAVGMAATQDLGGVVLACWALGAAVMTSYTRARAERHLAQFTVGLMERGERCAVLILGALSGFLVLALWLVAIGGTVTALQRLVVARRLLTELDRTGRDPTVSCEPDEAADIPKPHVGVGGG